LPFIYSIFVEEIRGRGRYASLSLIASEVQYYFPFLSEVWKEGDNTEHLLCAGSYACSTLSDIIFTTSLFKRQCDYSLQIRGKGLERLRDAWSLKHGARHTCSSPCQPTISKVTQKPLLLSAYSPQEGTDS
jgi:hypothetical protein